MVEFVKGDKLVCPKGKEAFAEHQRLEAGGVYTFVRYGDHRRGPYGLVYVEERKPAFYINRFELHKEEKPVAKAGDLVIPREFPRGNGGPGWHEGLMDFVGKPVVAVENNGFAGRPWLMIDLWYWPISHLDVVKQGEPMKQKKPAKKKVVKPKKVRVKALRTLLIKAASAAACCSLAVRYNKEGKGDYVDGYAPCHARFGYLTGKPIEIAVYYTKQLHGYGDFSKNNDKKVFASFVNYCLNRSPFADAFLTKKASEAYARGIKMNVNQSCSMVAFGAIAIRQATEHNGCLNAWEFARKHKFSEDASFFFAINHNLINGKWAFAGDRGHALIAGSMEFDKCINVFKDGLVKYPGIIGEPGEGYQINASWYKGAARWAGGAKAADQSIQSVLDKVGPAETIGEGFDKKIVLTDASILKRLQHIESAIINVRKGK